MRQAGETIHRSAAVASSIRKLKEYLQAAITIFRDGKCGPARCVLLNRFRCCERGNPPAEPELCGVNLSQMASQVGQSSGKATDRD